MSGGVAVRPLRRPGGLPPLFLIAAPDVNALGYVALAKSLRPRESPFAVQAAQGAPVAGERDHEPEQIAAFAADYLAAVRARQPEGPYFLAGMCDGAHIAFAMARALEAEGQRVALLAILDTWPVENSAHQALVVIESFRKQLAPLGWAARLRWIRRGLGRAAARARSRLAGERTAPAPPSDIERWRARAWPGPGFVPPVYGGRITVLRARRQPYYRLRDATLGWSARSREPVDVRVVPGDHLGLLRKPVVEAVARALGEALDEARDRAGLPPARVEMRRLW